MSKNTENYIVINGKRAELTEEQLKQLGIKPEDPEEKYPPKFKAGDCVKVIHSTKTLGRQEEYEGKTFTIKYVYKLSEYAHGSAPNTRAYDLGALYVAYENELELSGYEDLFKRVYGELYHYIDEDNGVLVKQEYLNEGSSNLYETGNYCKDEALMKQRALHETLNRLLWRASVIAGELDNSWELRHYHYYIYYDVDSCVLTTSYNDSRQVQGTCYFPTDESARGAIENIIKPFLKEHPDFKW